MPGVFTVLYMKHPFSHLPSSSSLHHTRRLFFRWRCEQRQQRRVFSSEGPSSFVHVTQTKKTSGTDGTLSDKPTSTVSLDQQEATRLVDNLLAYTRSLMDNTPSPVSSLSHSNNGKNSKRQDKHHVLAFSGGVDSSLVAQLLYMSAKADERVTAVLGVSAAVPQSQIQLAQQVAQHIAVDLQTVSTTEGTDDTYIANAGQACYACKTHLYRTMQSIFLQATTGSHLSEQSNAHDRRQLLFYNGTNADDLLDPTRLGLIAAKEFSVQSPLCQTPKSLVRVAARHLQLPNWDYAASPCLRSRLALGVPATEDHLQRMEAAEALVKKVLNIPVTVNLRVRMLSNNRVRIELDENWLESANIHIHDWKELFERDGNLLFDSVSVKAFKSGSVARISK